LFREVFNLDSWKNSVLIESVIKALYTVASRRTSLKSAGEAIGSSIKTLENKYEFLKFIDTENKDFAQGGFAISVSSDVNKVDTSLVGKAIESLIRVVCSDIGSEAGLYFITELKEHTGEEISKMINNIDIDLDQIQFEQHYVYRRTDRKRKIEQKARTGMLDSKKPDNLLGYAWDNVSSWRHEPGSKYCTLYDKEGKIIDRLNLDHIVKNYVEKLSGYIDVDPHDIEREAQIYEKEYHLLKLMLAQDMNAETAQHILKVSRDELNRMIKKLSGMELLQFVSFDTLEITETGIGYISKKDKKQESA
jgi:hypothetical protein